MLIRRGERKRCPNEEVGPQQEKSKSQSSLETKGRGCQERVFRRQQEKSLQLGSPSLIIKRGNCLFPFEFSTKGNVN